jgi:branched-chain amino acid transport system permease protein
MLGAALAGLTGVMGGAFLSLYPGADSEILLLGLVVVIIGGMGSLEGAIVGSLVVGLLDTFGKALFPELAYFTIFGPMAIMLALRPSGLFGRLQ